MWGFKGGKYYYCGIYYYDMESCHSFGENICTSSKYTEEMESVCAIERPIPTYNNVRCLTTKYQNIYMVKSMFMSQNNWKRNIYPPFY
jgi:hypothetical protein